MVCGVGLGILGSGVRKLGPGVAGVSAVGVAIPTFVAAQFLVLIFALHLGWFPTIGAGSWFADRVWHLTLPAIALAIGAAAYVAQVTRASIFEEQAREHVDVARGRGIPEAVVFRRHVLRNALVPITTVSALTAAGLIAGAAVVVVRVRNRGARVAPHPEFERQGLRSRGGNHADSSGGVRSDDSAYRLGAART